MRRPPLVRLVFAFTALLALPAYPQAMRQAADRLLAAVPETARGNIQRPFDDRDRLDWHYTPRSRNGAALKELDARGREAVHALLRTALSFGARQGLRVLAAEEDEARALLGVLDEAQRREAVFESRTYGEIVTANADKVDPLKPVGIAAAKFDEKQRAQLMKLIEAYAGSFEPGLAQARLARVREGGVENVRFGWAGSTERGRQHYYRIQGPRFLIEYDASQNDGNHVHTVWRDFSGDFGRDLLRQHYTLARGSSHRH